MTTTTVNAIHQPRNFVPADYRCVGAIDFGADRWTEDDREMFALLDASSTSRIADSTGRTQCDHCGARIRYGAVLLHIPSSEHIVVGETCLSNRVGDYSHAQFRLDFIRTAAQNTRAHNARLAARAAFVAEHPEIADLADDSIERSGFYGSLAAALLKWGNLSERQISAYVASKARDIERAAARAEREAQPKVEAPEGKQVVTGEVVSIKLQESDFNRYGTLKMVVRDDRGFAVWVTVPSSIDPQVGDRVTFTATLQQSDRDECFAFGKRPTKAQVLS